MHCNSHVCRAWAAIAFLVLSPTSAAADVRIETRAYHDDTQSWVLGQVQRLVINGIETERTTFNDKALPVHRLEFGQRVSTTSYHPDGSVASVSDGNDEVTRYDDYQRAIPRRITYADGSQQTATVDADGLLSSVTNEVGATTCYGFDAMGRLARITPPSELKPGCAQEGWWIENISFRALGAGEVLPAGVVAGQWLRTRQSGSRRELTYFDALWRPVLTHLYDESDKAGTLRAQSREFDGQGRLVFQSYFANQIVPPALGSWTQYDALDRVTAEHQDSELGRLSTRTAYGPGLQRRVTNARGQVTTTHYLAYGQPHYDWPVLSELPEGVVSEISRDVFGKPLRITRRGASGLPRADRYAVYDAQQRLCKTVEPETGASVYAHDAAGNLLGSAIGVPGIASTAGCDVDAARASGRWVTRRYDARQRLTTLQFPDGQGDQAWRYTANGLPARVIARNAGGAQVITTYAYNRLGLLVSETSQQPNWYAWTSVYAYDGHGQLRMQGYPTGLSIHYTLNALGQATRVTDNFGQVYARDIGYHPNGALKQFTYGNGILHSTQQNIRQLPARIIDANVTDFSYGYDANANPLSIRAVAPALNRYSGNRDMAYDGLDRLIYAHLQYQQIDRWHYDALDRLAHHDHFNGVANTRHTYYYDGTNRLANVVNAGTGASIAGLAWDAQGNLSNKNGQRSVFDFGNRLREIPGKAWYRYDGLGRRVLSAQPDGIGVYQYSRAGQLLYYEQNGQGNYEQIYLAGRLLASRNKGVISYQHTDALGSPIAESNAAGITTARTDYGPFGQVLSQKSYNRIGLAGHLHDGATGLVQMQQRYYDPALHTFLSVDPVGAFESPDPRLFNRYVYAANNPYRYRDPDGRIIETGWDAINVAMDVASLTTNLAVGNYGGAALDAAGLLVDAAATAVPGVPGGAGAAIKAYRVAGMAREARVTADLIASNPGAKVQVQQVLRTADGKKAVDQVTGKGRVVDQVVIRDGKAMTYETTSLTANKASQLKREQRILDNGGAYIRDRETRVLVPVHGRSQLKREP